MCVRPAALALAFLALATTSALADDYPAPPHQTDPCTPPATTLVAAVDTAPTPLFDRGLADPRGLDYRAIELDVGEPWHGVTEPLKTHGWIIPKTTFAVAWNGLVYQTRSIGDTADVATDVRAMLAADTAARTQAKRDNPDSDYFRFPSAYEGFFVAIETMSPLKVAMLLRLGHGLTSRRGSGRRRSTARPIRCVCSPATGCGRRTTARHHGAHARRRRARDRELAAPARARTVDREQGARPRLPHRHRRGARRRAPPRRAPDATRGPQGDRPRCRRGRAIAALIAALDQVAARQWGQPGGVALGEDPIEQALIAQGDAAVEPLIAAFEGDDRRTRSVQFWRDFARHREVLAVYEAAYVALSGVLDMSFFQPMSTGDNLTARGPEGRRKLGDQLRAYWQKWKGVSKEERARTSCSPTMLAAPTAGSPRPRRSPNQPSNVQNVPASSSIDQYTLTTQLPAGQKPTLRGEALRAKASPSVTELFAKRLPAFTDLRERARWFPRSLAVPRREHLEPPRARADR